jgi:hypothetical protein
MTAIIPGTRGGAVRSLPQPRSRACRPERVMNDLPQPPESPEDVPLGQRLFDNVFLLLAAGLVVMLVLYTGWGLWEITSLPAGPLP